MVGVDLIGVRGGRAVVARVANAIRVAIGLGRVVAGGAIVAEIAHAVAVGVELRGIDHQRAIVGEVDDAVCVGVGGAGSFNGMHRRDRVQIETLQLIERG